MTAGGAGRSGPEVGSAVRILIIDDSERQRTALQSILHEEGHRDILLAESASEAMSILHDENAVDLVLLNELMADMNGTETCRRIKDQPCLKDASIIMVTASQDADSLKEAFQAGAVDYIVGPPDPVQLKARLNSVVNLKEERDQRRSREQELLELNRKLVSANQMLRRLAVVDSLTGIANRRYFDEILSQEWRRGERDNLPLSLVMADIDFFKLYNDRFGHQAGDDCLRKVAEALHGALRRPGDALARYGGEEFAAVLPNTPFPGAEELAEAMRLAVENLSLAHPDSSVLERVTVSLGLASTQPGPGTGPESLVAAADEALYRAKRAGRNRVAGPPQDQA